MKFAERCVTLSLGYVGWAIGDWFFADYHEIEKLLIGAFTFLMLASVITAVLFVRRQV